MKQGFIIKDNKCKEWNESGSTMKDKSNYYIKSIKRAIRVLDSFSLEENELGVTELSKKLKLHKSTVHRILVTLESEGVVVRKQSNQKYSLGMSLFRWGSIAQMQIDIRKYALPEMENLAKKTGECVYLNIISGKKRISIEKVESDLEVRRVIKLGEPLPLYTGGSGKVLLAYLPDKEIEKFTAEEKLISYTPNTITEPKKLLENLKEIREKGYGIGVGERIKGATTIGAPVFDNTNKVVASLTISGPTERFDDDKISQFVPLLKESADNISSLLGYHSLEKEK